MSNLVRVRKNGTDFNVGAAYAQAHQLDVLNESAYDSDGSPRDSARTARAESPGGYHALTVADLKAEIGQRNAGRDPEGRIEPDGTKKADLASALEADDTEKE